MQHKGCQDGIPLKLYELLQLYVVIYEQIVLAVESI